MKKKTHPLEDTSELPESLTASRSGANAAAAAAAIIARDGPTANRC